MVRTTHHVDLYLIRHGVTEWNKQKRFIGFTDHGLAQEAYSQIIPTAKALQHINFDRVYCSDLKRCTETLYAILGASAHEGHVHASDLTTNEHEHVDNKVQFDWRLREMHFGEFEGYTHEELSKRDDYIQWLSRWEEIAPPLGEDFPSFRNRVLQCLNGILNDIINHYSDDSPNESPNETPHNRSSHVINEGVNNSLNGQSESPPVQRAEKSNNCEVLIVTHGGVIRSILSTFVRQKTFWEWNIPHGQGYKLSLKKSDGQFEHIQTVHKNVQNNCEVNPHNQVKEGWSCYSWLEVPTQEKEVSLKNSSQDQ